MKYQAKIGVVSQVLARGGAISEAEARQLSDCVNTTFDGINFKYRREMSHVARRVRAFSFSANVRTIPGSCSWLLFIKFRY